MDPEAASEARLRRLEARLLELEQRLRRLEQTEPAPPPAAPPQLGKAPAATPVPAAAPAAPAAAPAPLFHPTPPTQAAPRSPAGATRPPATGPRDIEQLLGANWLAKAGVVVLVLGVAFFLKYAFENDWIGLTARIVLGVVGGAAIWITGDVLHQRGRYGVYPQILAGGGAIIVYFSLFAAYAFPEYRRELGISLEVDSILLGLLALGLALYAAWRDTPALAAQAVGLGTVTSFLAAQWDAFSVFYAVALAGAIVGIAVTWRRWPLTAGLALLAAYGALALNLLQDVDAVVIMVGALALLPIFTLASQRLPTRENGLPAAFLTGAGGFLATWGLLAWGLGIEDLQDWRGPVTAALAIGAGALAWVTPTERGARAGFWLAAAVMALAWPPIQFDGVPATFAWTGLLMAGALVAFNRPGAGLTYANLAAGVLLALHLSAEIAPDVSSGRIDSAMGLLAFLGATLAYFVAWRASAPTPDREVTVQRVHLALALLVPLLYMAVSLKGYWISIAWTLEAVLVVIAGFALAIRDLRLAAFGLFAAVLARVFILDMAGLEVVYRIVTFIVVGGLLLGASFLYARAKH